MISVLLINKGDKWKVVLMKLFMVPGGPELSLPRLPLFVDIYETEKNNELFQFWSLRTKLFWFYLFVFIFILKIIEILSRYPKFFFLNFLKFSCN